MYFWMSARSSLPPILLCPELIECFSYKYVHLLKRFDAVYSAVEKPSRRIVSGRIRLLDHTVVLEKTTSNYLVLESSVKII